MTRSTFFPRGDGSPLFSWIRATLLLPALSALLVSAPPFEARAGAKPVPPKLEALEGSLEFTPFHDKAFLAARKSGRPVVLYFGAEWCAPCKELEARTFRAPAVLEAAAGIRFFHVDMTTPSGYLELVKKSFRVEGAPTLVVFGADGKESGRHFGYIPAADFSRMLADSRQTAQST